MGDVKILLVSFLCAMPFSVCSSGIGDNKKDFNESQEYDIPSDDINAIEEILINDFSEDPSPENLTDQPRRCTMDYECNDGIFCNGQEKCIDGECFPAEKTACEDDIECTEATCDESLHECHYTPNHSICDDNLYCNGQERCSVLYGCVNGTAPDCDDGDRCTTDYCDEENDRCINDPRDEDKDGYMDRSCGGDDCNDNDPAIYPGAEEICNDGKDNDCNNYVDMYDPTCLEHLCDTAQVINVDFSGGNFSWTGSGTTSGEVNKFEATCAGSARSPDIPYKLVVPSRASVIIEVTNSSYDTALHVRTRCGDSASEIYCDDDSGSCSFCSRISATLNAGTYIVIMDGYGSSSSGNYTLTITASPAP